SEPINVRGRYNATNQGRPFQRNNARGNGVAGNIGAQNRGGMTNPGQAKPIKCYNCNGLGHIAHECPRPKRLQDSDYFKDKMLLIQAQENGAVLDEEQSLFLAGEQVTNFDAMMWMIHPRMIWHSMWIISLKLIDIC
ncbi:integrase, catalytic region, zinc finger, CCHC-type containing protein, partial [Tanacetum coccineum]